MASFAAQLLNELMGADRNSDPNEKKREIRFDDPEICRHFLCGFCPSDLFTNTRADLGPCGKLHDEEIRNKYKASSRFEKVGYEEDFVSFLQSLLTDVDKRIRKGHARLSLNNASGSMMGAPQVEREEKVNMLTEKINELVEQAEQLGCEGKVEEAQGVMKLCEQLREERTHLETIGQRPDQGTNKDMEVCDVCGALLVVGDAQQRIDEHIMGKQHMGYARIRTYIESFKQKQLTEETDRIQRLQQEREAREKEREKERQERDRQREERQRETERSGGGGGGERRRRRSRSADRRRRSRSRSRHKRSRSRDRRRRSRSRSRGHRSSRDHDRKRRSRSRESRRHRSRDRENGRDSRSREKPQEERKDSPKESAAGSEAV